MLIDDLHVPKRLAFVNCISKRFRRLPKHMESFDNEAFEDAWDIRPFDEAEANS